MINVGSHLNVKFWAKFRKREWENRIERNWEAKAMTPSGGHGLTNYCYYYFLIWFYPFWFQALGKYRCVEKETDMLLSTLSAMQEKAQHLEYNLSAETRIKLDLFSALGDARRQLEIAQGSQTFFVLHFLGIYSNKGFTIIIKLEERGHHLKIASLSKIGVSYT